MNKNYVFSDEWKIVRGNFMGFHKGIGIRHNCGYNQSAVKYNGNRCVLCKKVAPKQLLIMRQMLWDL